MDMVTQLTEKVNKIFDATYLDEVAREVNFIKRQRKVTAKDFLENLIFLRMESKQNSLEDLAFEFDKKDICISKQALHKKCNEKAISFVQRVSKELLDFSLAEKKLNLGALPFVKRIKTVDSSNIKLNSRLKHVFPGLRNHGAALKLQATMSVLDNQLLSLEARPSRETDQSYRDYIEHIEEGDLSINDLGYFCIDSLKKIQDKKAFFLSRHHRGTKVYKSKGQDIDEEIDLTKLLRSTKETKVELEVLLSNKKFSCRFFALKLPPESYEQRLKNIKEKQRKNGHSKTKKNSILDKWSIFVTNIADEVQAETLLDVYRLRWQIELFFKMAKTFSNIRQINYSNQHQVLISLYTSLITITLVALCSLTLEDVEISLYKAANLFTKTIRAFFDLVRVKKNAIAWFAQKLSKFALKESRIKRPSTKQLLGINYA